MLKLIIKVGIICVAVALLNFALFFILPPIEDDYSAAFIDKNNLLRAKDRPSIILVGGSSVAFDYDSQLMSELVDMPVINTGVHAGYRLRFYIDSVMPYVETGDIILLQLEYTHFIGSPDTEAYRLRNLVAANKQFISYISTPGQISAMIQIHPEYTLQQLITLFTAVDTGCPGKTYCRSSFNEYGDIKETIAVSNEISQIRLANDLVGDTVTPTTQLSPEAINLVNAFADAVRARGAQIFIIYPPLPDTLFEQDQTMLLTIQENINDSIDIEDINQPYKYDQSLFFDSKYHLNVEGRKLHTQYAATLLLEALAS